MQRRVLTYLLLTATLSTACPLVGQRAGRNEEVKLESFTYETGQFHSPSIDDDANFAIYLPVGYGDQENAERRYPLVLWLHGMFENCTRFHVRGGAEVLDESVKSGKLPPCIFVCAEVGSRSMYVNRPGKHWEDLIWKDLVAHLEKNYRLRPERDQRAICGVSMGGMAALRIAFEHPELFGTVATHSAAVFPEDPDDLPPQFKQFAVRLGLDEVFGNPIELEPWQAANPLCIAMKLDPEQLHGLRIYFDAGDQDRYQFHRSNEMLHKVLEKQGIEHTWRLIEGGGHSWGANFQHATLPHSFSMIGEAFRMAAARGKALEHLRQGVDLGKPQGREPDATDPARPGGGR